MEEGGREEGFKYPLIAFSFPPIFPTTDCYDICHEVMQRCHSDT